MVWGPVRMVLYFVVWIFSVILIGLTSSRIHFTHNQPIGFFAVLMTHPEPISAEILAASIIALIWSTVMVFLLLARVGGALASYFTENVMNFIIWVLYLVGNAIFSHKFAHIGHCRRFSEQCRVITAIMAFAWINWAIFTFLILISLGQMAAAGATVFSPMYAEKEGAPETRERPVAA